MRRPAHALLVALALFAGTSLAAQDRLKTMPGYDRFIEMGREIPNAVKLGALAATWDDDGSGVRYARDGKTWRFDVATKQVTEAPATAPNAAGPARVPRARPPVRRGLDRRQRATRVLPRP